MLIIFINLLQWVDLFDLLQFVIMLVVQECVVVCDIVFLFFIVSLVLICGLAVEDGLFVWFSVIMDVVMLVGVILLFVIVLVFLFFGVRYIDGVWSFFLDLLYLVYQNLGKGEIEVVMVDYNLLIGGV